MTQVRNYYFDNEEKITKQLEKMRAQMAATEEAAQQRKQQPAKKKKKKRKKVPSEDPAVQPAGEGAANPPPEPDAGRFNPYAERSGDAAPGIVERQAVASSAVVGGDSLQGSGHGMSASGHPLTASGHPMDLGLYHRQLLMQVGVIYFIQRARLVVAELSPDCREFPSTRWRSRSSVRSSSSNSNSRSRR